MTDARLRAAAAVAAVGTAAAGLVVFWLAVESPALSPAEPAKAAAVVPFVLGMVLLSATGVMLVRHRARSPIAWLLLATGLAGVLARLMLGVAVLADEHGHPSADALGWTTNWSWLPMQVLAMLLVLRFPDGTLPTPRWRWAQRTVVAWGAAALVVTALLPGALGAEQLAPRTNPLGLSALSRQLDAALGALFLAQPLLIVLVTAAPAVRWRRADRESRRQLTLVAAALLLLALASPLALATHAGVMLEGIAWLLVPLSITYAVARHGLWDIESRRQLYRLRLVREDERARLQRDLHDSLGPVLGSIAMRTEAARNLVAAGAPAGDVDRVLLTIGADAENAVVEVRRFIEELGPSSLADADLATALGALAEEYDGTGLAVTVSVPPDLPLMEPAAEIALYRVAAEALRNVHRHAEATTCLLRLRRDGGEVVLDIIDDGVGLRGQPAGVGRRAMADRVAALGGVLELADAAGGGVHVRARMAGVAR